MISESAGRIEIRTEGPYFLHMHDIERTRSRYEARRPAILKYVHGQLSARYPGLDKAGLADALGTPVLDGRTGRVDWTCRDPACRFSFACDDDFRTLGDFRFEPCALTGI